LSRPGGGAETAVDRERIAAKPRIHLINRFELLAGSEMRALGLARILSGHADVRLWAMDVPDRRLPGPVPVEQIEPRKGRFPRSGIFVFVGVYYSVGRWVRLTRPSRRIIIFNTPQPELFVPFERETARTLTLRPVPCEIVYACDLLPPMLGRPGHVQASPIDIREFQPRTRPRAGDAADFRVGRLSREHPEKFHEDDAALFRMLAQNGVEVQLMGGACLGLAPSPRITVTATASRPALQFLQSLDCFVYRTRSTWLDTFSRVVFEAMACGLPVVVGRRGGHAAHISHGVNGYLFDSSEEAVAHVLRLRGDPELRAHLGRNARQTVERLFSASYNSKIIEYYTGTAPAAPARSWSPELPVTVGD
jgi:glycosyltransferase involved in cell wall biosynthesis